MAHNIKLIQSSEICFMHVKSNIFLVSCAILILILPKINHAQNLRKLASLPSILTGSSGIEVTKAGNIWTINDHGKPFLYQIDKSTGEILRTVFLNNKVKDWEDLSIDNLGNFYIGDFGNNHNNRRDLKIYKLPNPDSIQNKVTTAKVIRFSFADQKEFPPSKDKYEFDVEAMIHFSGKLYLFSKSRGKPFKGKVKMYRLNDEPGEYVAELMDSVFLGDGNMYGNWITGATLLENDSILALLSHDKIFFFSCFEKDQFFTGKLNSLHLNHFSQKESIAYNSASERIIITDELTKGVFGGNVYYIPKPNFFTNCNE